jgi:glycosyltransferase involved in cell wall biosynthesis
MDSMDRPLVSVIVAVSDGERFVSSALHSIFKQNYHPFELIVVDGQSVDHTAVIAQSFEPVKYIYQARRGLANGRNIGIEAAQGELIAFLDSDDLWTPDKLNVQIHYLLKNPEVQYVNAWVKLFVEPGSSLRSRYTKEFLGRAHVGRTPGTLVARKSVFDLVGMFSADFSIACDVEWFKRANDHNIPAFIIPEVLLYKRIHNRNLSSNVKTNRREVLSIIKQTIRQQRLQKTGTSHE